MTQETIPEDVMYEANLAAGHIEEQCVWGDGEGGLNYDRAAIIIARAILAERERSARVADKVAAEREALRKAEVEDGGDDGEVYALNGQRFIAECIATDIRAGSNP